MVLKKDFKLNKNQINLLFNEGHVKLPQFKWKADLNNINDVQNQNKNFIEFSILHQKYIKQFDIINSLQLQLKELAENKLGIKIKTNNIYCITRVISTKDTKEAYRAHFDSHVFTLITPVKIPKIKNNSDKGELVLFPKLRNEPKNEIINMIGKVNFKKFNNEIKLNELKDKKKFIEFDFFDMEPAIFLGRQGLHFNKPLKLSEGSTRITLLTHFFDPSPFWSIGNVNRLLRNR